MGKLLKTLLVSCVVGVIGLALAKDLIAKAVIEGGIKAVTGLSAKVADAQVGLLNTTAGVRGCRSI